MNDEQSGSATPPPDASTDSAAPAGADQPAMSPTNQTDVWPAPRLVDNQYRNDGIHHFNTITRRNHK